MDLSSVFTHQTNSTQSNLKLVENETVIPPNGFNNWDPLKMLPCTTFQCRKDKKKCQGFSFFFVKEGLFSPRSQTAVHQMLTLWCHHRWPAQLLSRSRHRGRSGYSAYSLWFARLWEEHQSLAKETLPDKKHNHKDHILGFIYMDTELKKIT